jgi:biopolymer transport protein ExbB
MAEIRQMAELIWDAIGKSGEVRMVKGTIINRSGEKVQTDILLLGNFTAAYRLEGETGFLNYLDKTHNFHALTKLPPRRMQKKLKAYMAGQSDDVPIDISRGGALRQLTHQLSLVEQISKGGPIVWPILMIFVVAVLIIIERSIFFIRKRIDADIFMSRLNDLIRYGKWEECAGICEKNKSNPLAKVLMAGVEFCDMDRMDMENALQEAILREVPQLERFLSTLGMLASIAPLLGLLGTVTGMINTFHIITYYGAGDPRMMSGGISEALVTTMLGLSVAVPILICHTLLNRKVENTIGLLEEKAVSFVNVVFKNRYQGAGVREQISEAGFEGR